MRKESFDRQEILKQFLKTCTDIQAVVIALQVILTQKLSRLVGIVAGQLHYVFYFARKYAKVMSLKYAHFFERLWLSDMEENKPLTHKHQVKNSECKLLAKDRRWT